MGSASQIINFINRKKIPTEDEINDLYTHIEIDEILKNLRKNHRRQSKKFRNQQELF